MNELLVTELTGLIDLAADAGIEMQVERLHGPDRLHVAVVEGEVEVWGITASTRAPILHALLRFAQDHRDNLVDALAACDALIGRLE